MSLRKICKIVREVVVSDILKNRKEFIGDHETLEGACGYASYGLYRVLPNSQLVIGSYKTKDSVLFTHCWIELGEKIIDITATQFGINQEVYILQKKNNRAKRYIPEITGRKAIISLNDWGYPNNWKINLSNKLERRVDRLSY